MTTTKLKLTPDEEKALGCLEEKYEDICILTRLVATGHSTGLYIWGLGGIGKSYNVLATLKEMGRKYHLLNTRLSPPALAKKLDADKKGLFVVEDIEDAFTHADAMNLLRSAFYGQRDETGKMERPITYGTGHDKCNFDFKFGGAIIATGNRALGDIPQLQALKTRIDLYRLVVERDEIFAVGKKIALAGFKSDKGTLPPETCLEVFEFYKAKLPEDRPPDLRMLDRSYNKYLGLQKLGKVDRWQRLMLAAMLETSPAQVETPIRRLATIESVTADLRTKYGSDLKKLLPEWKAVTGQGKTAYYDALARLDKRQP